MKGFEMTQRFLGFDLSDDTIRVDSHSRQSKLRARLTDYLAQQCGASELVGFPTGRAIRLSHKEEVGFSCALSRAMQAQGFSRPRLLLLEELTKLLAARPNNALMIDVYRDRLREVGILERYEMPH